MRSGRFTHRVDRYAEAVLDRAIVAGPLVRLACDRHFRDRARAEGGGWFQFSTAFADQILDFYEGVLRLPDLVDEFGDPQPFRLDVGSGFWAFVLGSGFGWVDRQRLRRFREWFIETGKGSAKTPVLAGVGLYGLTSDGERAAEIYAAAADQDQAGIMFRDAVRIAKASPDLDEVLEYDGGSHIWQIRHPESLSFFKTFSRESGQKSGTRPHMGLLDELHEHPSHDTSVKVRAGAKRRPQPLFAEITNSGFDRTSICWQRHEHARRVVEQTVDDDRLFAYVCALDDGSSEHVGTSKRAVQIVLNSCTCHSVPTTLIDQLAAEGYAALATHAGMPPRAPSDAPNTLIGQCAPLESALPAITDSVRTTASMRSESEPRSSDGSQSMRIDSPPTSEIGSQSAQAIGSEWPRSRNSEHTASTRRDSTSLLLPSEASARAAEESHGSSPSTTTTLLADLEDCCASPAIRESVFSAILSKVYNAHSTTCAVRQQATISGDSVRYKYSADDPMVDPTCWPKTNPYLGVTVTEDYLRRQVENAKNIPAEMNGVLRLNFCVWTQSNERFFDAAKWQAGAVMPSDAELAAATCYAGIDAGQSDDISAFARLWVLDDGRVAVKMRYWLPQAALDKYPERPYAQWKASGLLTVTDGDVVDYEAIEQTVEDLCRESGVLQCGFDKRFLGQMSQRLAGAGLSMVDIPQGFHLNEAIKRVSEWVAGGELCHGGDPILAWMADNAVVKFGRNKEMRLDKEASKDKIDGIAALVIAARLVTLQEIEQPSVYETRGLATL